MGGEGIRGGRGKMTKGDKKVIKKMIKGDKKVIKKMIRR